MIEDKKKGTPEGAPIKTQSNFNTECNKCHGGNVMEERIVKIEVENGDLNAALDKVKEVIIQGIKMFEKDRTLARKASESYRNSANEMFAEIRESYGEEDPKGEDLAELIFAGGFRQGYLMAEADAEATRKQCCKESCD